MTETEPMTADDIAGRAHQARARMWRLGVGALGLLWVCVLVLLMR